MSQNISNSLDPEKGPDIETCNEQLNAQNKRSPEFSSENFKLEILHLPPHTKYPVLKQLLERNFKLAPHKIKVGNKNAFIAFSSNEERDQAIAKINNQEWKGRILIARPAEPRHDFIKRMRTAFHDNETTDEIEEMGNDDDINSQVCPLWRESYDQQLKIKQRGMRSVLNMAKHIAKLNPNLKEVAPMLHDWVLKNDQICCQFDGVEASPCLIGYRNKCEFNIGREGTVGFRLGRYKDNSERVVHPPPNCPIVNEHMFKILKTFQTFLQDKNRTTKLRGYDHATHAGNVRQLSIKTNLQGECLVIVDIHPQNLSDIDLEEETNSIVDLLKNDHKVVSIFLNISERNHFNSADHTLKLVYGKGYLYEYLHIDKFSPMKFRIGPNSFFQVNTRAAELLYRSIIELADLKSNSLVLDVGCGTGTIGLSLAKQVSYVIGIEIVQSAVEDAKINARENDVTNISFFVGKAEELINESMNILKTKRQELNNEGEIIAIVDPPRTGFNSSFIKSLRASTIQKIVYVACDPKANENLLSLCRPQSKAYQKEPFIPVRAKAFDLFPHTKFCELVIVYERLCDSKFES